MEKLENLKELYKQAKENIMKYSEDFLNEHKKNFDEYTSEQKEFVMRQYQEFRQAETKQLKKLKQAYETFETALFCNY